MDRRNFSKGILLSALAVPQISMDSQSYQVNHREFKEDISGLPVREFDVIVAEVAQQVLWQLSLLHDKVQRLL